MLSVSGIHTFYGHIKALHGVDLEIHEGEIVALIGANGAGKSTLLMTICGDPRAQSGQILFQGRDITQMRTHDIMRCGISHSPEGRRIFPRMTILENLQMGAIMGNPNRLDQNLERVFALFPILQERGDQRGGTLSGGEQQMLAIARALMSEPSSYITYLLGNRLCPASGITQMPSPNANVRLQWHHSFTSLETFMIV